MMCDCAVDLVDLRARVRLMEKHYHEDMNELFDELKRLKRFVERIEREDERELEAA